MAFRELPPRRRNPQIGIAAIVIGAVLVLAFGRTICSYVIDYFWWREMGQVPTWVRMTAYRYVPGLAAWVIVFAVLWVAHARGMKHAGERLRRLARLRKTKHLGASFRRHDPHALDCRWLDRRPLRRRPRRRVLRLDRSRLRQTTPVLFLRSPASTACC